MIARPLVFAVACIALSGCGQKAQKKTDTRAAEGQVLGGTISDSMLPLATVTSTSPPDNKGDEGSSGTKPTPAPAPTPSSDISAAPSDNPSAAAPAPKSSPSKAVSSSTASPE